MSKPKQKSKSANKIQTKEAEVQKTENKQSPGKNKDKAQILRKHWGHIREGRNTWHKDDPAQTEGNTQASVHKGGKTKHRKSSKR